MKYLYILWLAVLLLAPTDISAWAQETGSIALYTDISRTDADIFTTPYVPFHFYIFVQPSADGLTSTQYRLDFPSEILGMSCDPNATVPLTEVTGDIFGSGLTSEYTECQTDLFMAQIITCLPFSSVPSYIWVQSHEDSGIMGAVSCLEPDHPVEDYIAPWPLWLNMSAWHIPPRLSGVEPTSPISIFAEFDNCVDYMHNYNNSFFIYDSANPQDTIKVFKVWRDETNDSYFDLVLFSPMVPGTDYVLVANNICCDCHGCANSSMEFHYDGNFEDKPDLWVTGMTTETWSPNACEPFQVGYTIYNAGTLPSGPFTVRGIILYSPGGVYTRETLFLNEYTGLEADSTLTDSLLISIPDHSRSRTYVGIHVDYYDDVDEWTDYNNYKTLDFENYNPYILAIDDKPDDTGGWVTLSFKASPLKSFYPGTDMSYDILRRIYDSDMWDIVAHIVDSGTDIYECNVPTVADSGEGGQTNWGVFKVILTAPDDVPPEERGIYISCPDSGYSVDNSIATLLQAHAAGLDDSGILISWKLSSGDFSGTFTIDRSEDGAVFLPINDPIVEYNEGEFRFLDDSIIPGRSYRYRICCIESGSSTALFETERIQIPDAALTLYQNSPNPFNPATTVSWFLPEAMRVRLEIFDVSGRSIRLLGDEVMEPGRHSIVWNGTGENGSAVSSGIYFLKLSAGKKTITRKMVLLK